MDKTSFLYVATQVMPATVRAAHCCYNCKRFRPHGMMGIVDSWCPINGKYVRWFDTCDSIHFGIRISE